MWHWKIASGDQALSCCMELLFVTPCWNEAITWPEDQWRHSWPSFKTSPENMEDGLSTWFAKNTWPWRAWRGDGRVWRGYGRPMLSQGHWFTVDSDNSGSPRGVIYYGDLQRGRWVIIPPRAVRLEIASLDLVRFWCLFVSKKTQTICDARKLDCTHYAGCWQAQWVQSNFVTSLIVWQLFGDKQTSKSYET